MNNDKQLANFELNRERLREAALILANNLEAAADAYLKKGKLKADMSPWRRVLLPAYYIRAQRLSKRAHVMRKLASQSDLELNAFDSEARYMCELSIFEAEQNFPALVSVGKRIFSDTELDLKLRSRLLKNYSTLMGVCDFLPQRTDAPDWRKPDRVAYIAATSLPYAVSGYTTRTEGVALGYMALGIDLQVITSVSFPLNIRKDLAADDVPDIEEYNGVTYHRLKDPQRVMTKLEYVMFAADMMTNKLRELRPEYVIAGSNHVNALPALIAARRLGIPFFYEIRGFWEMSRATREPEFSNSIEFAVSQQLEAFVAKSADHVLTLTSQMRDDLVARGVENAKISLMPNGVVKDFVRSLTYDTELAKRLNLPNSCPVIGYIGSILEYEGLQDLAQACVGLAKRGLDFRLLIVGREKWRDSNGTPITDEIREIFKLAGISERLIMPGQVPFSEVERYYSLIDIAPIPRRPYDVAKMVTPIKPLEAMATAKAVIVSDVNALSDLVEDGVTGMVFRAGDVGHLEEQLSRLISDRQLIGGLQKAGQEFVKNNRTWELICAAAASDLKLSSGKEIPEKIGN